MVPADEVPMGHHRRLPDEEGGSHLGTSDEEAYRTKKALNPRYPRHQRG